MVNRQIKKWLPAWLMFLVMLLALACAGTSNPLVMTAETSQLAVSATTAPGTPAQNESIPGDSSLQFNVRAGNDPSIQTPTPDAPRSIPTLRSAAIEHVVQAGDTLGKIANRYGTSLESIAAANGLTNPDMISPGQLLLIPAPIPGPLGTSFKVVPDSELVFGPSSDGFDIGGFLARFDSYLPRYQEEVEGQVLNGVQIVERVSREFSVSPRLLLAVLEYQSGWISLANPAESTRVYPIGIRETWREGLYAQLAWAANNLSRGYYLWKVNAVGAWELVDGSFVPLDATMNAGTAGVQQMFALLYERESWDRAVSAQGLYQTYSSLFGYPFDYTIEPLLPAGLSQPEMQLPFEAGVTWAFTGGPHGGWADGAAWAALDFAPDVQGCENRGEWVTAVADGLIIRAESGAVVQDLDGDGREGTGWTVLYMHIASAGRVASGTYLQAGQPIGHPSCEGGFSTGTHLHLARRYNGEWIAADGDIPFVLDGWVSSGTGIAYDGYLRRDGQQIEAWDGFFPENTFSRP